MHENKINVEIDEKRWNMKYRYFVSYSHEKGFGMIDISTGSKIKCMDDIIEIKKCIEEKKPKSWKSSNNLLAAIRIKEVTL